MSYSQRVKNYAYALNPDVWASYSGKDRKVKRSLDACRLRSLQEAARLLGETPDGRPERPAPSAAETLRNAILELAQYARHTDSCGDAASHYNAEHYCGCGLTALKEHINTLLGDHHD